MMQAKDEILRRIKQLSAEEDTERRRAEHLMTEANRAVNHADALATVRRQYEFAFEQLGGEFPTPGTVVPVRRGGRLIGQLG